VNERPTPSARRLILLVEDNKADVFLIRAGIAAAKVAADLQVAPNGEAAILFLEEAERNEEMPGPALVILDLNLPRKSGAEVLRHLRAMHRLANAPVMVVTSSDNSGDRALAVALGANWFIQKPSEYNAYLKLGETVKFLVEQTEA
jgi:CheY-like chemotaxis protein